MNKSIVLKTLKVYGERTQTVENCSGNYQMDNIYPKNTKRIVKKLCFFPLKIKDVVQKCTVEIHKDTSDLYYYNKWHDLK
jgi:hypothetical protein